MLSILSTPDTRRICFDIIVAPSVRNTLGAPLYICVYPTSGRVRGTYLLDCMDRVHREHIQMQFTRHKDKSTVSNTIDPVIIAIRALLR
jgi:hypothetical protein